jgi:hypothetical protein
MNQRFNPNKNKSQIVFNITDGKKTYKTMALTTIPKQSHFVRSPSDDRSLRTADIEGAQFQQNPIKTRDHTLNITDIDGTRPSTSYDVRRPPVDILSVHDIEGAQPRIHHNLPHSNRHTNPLNPDYQLPVVEEAPPPELLFIYDGLNYDDIPGVHPKSYKTDKPPRDILKTNDIAGATPRSRIQGLKSGFRDNLDVSDINNTNKFHTKRQTNPLTPIYEIGGEVLSADYGIAQSNYLMRLDGRDFSLKTDDIDGAHSKPARKCRVVSRLTNLEEYPTSLMLPSMYQQTSELEHQKKIQKHRSERISRFEHHHHPHEGQEVGDKLQHIIRNERKHHPPQGQKISSHRKIEL